MKTTHALVVSLILTAVSTGFAQSKGGGSGGGGGDNPGRGKGGSDRPALPGSDRPAKPEATPQRDDLPPPSGKGEGKAARSAAPAARSFSDSLHNINQTAFAQRRELHQTLDMRLESSRDALKKIQTDAKAARVDARADFKSALDLVKKRETELADAVKASKKVDEPQWNRSRDVLARAYQAHSDALARLESIPRPRL